MHRDPEQAKQINKYAKNKHLSDEQKMNEIDKIRLLVYVSVSILDAGAEWVSLILLFSALWIFILENPLH